MPDLIPLLTWLVKATAVLAAARVLSIGLRRSTAGTRYLVWLATLGAVMVLPAVSW